MNYQLDNLRINLFNVVRDLATGKGEIKGRLKIAYKTFHKLRSEEFPARLKESWNIIDSNLKKSEKENDNFGETVIDKMDDETCVDLATLICNLMWDSVDPATEEAKPTS
ncbi:hypothetical protein [Parapedobacter koreensis]|uniref:Uncharacterized protein n=1 Tax=Parapedobacter koreensis TaxID=332977 RepID=A0A1H7FGY2_9SPHI|nr:hypothetical protein [Parapedobacter koreensis]SEK25228.1 hypothetical protein SAMN05421740_101347 [Parapedobacter koreensis]